MDETPIDLTLEDIKAREQAVAKMLAQRPLIVPVISEIVASNEHGQGQDLTPVDGSKAPV
jgi:hypothetical protein